MGVIAGALVLMSLLAAITASLESGEVDVYDFPALVKVVNEDPDTTWVATVPPRNLSYYAQTCGAILRGDDNYVEENLPPHPEFSPLADAIDWRTRAPNCTTISKVHDQGACGSCWAWASTEAFEDRRCISTGVSIELSAQDTAGCCTGFSCGLSHGCKGGQPAAALRWLSENGVVTGGDFDSVGSGKSCKPYLLPGCNHHVPATPKHPECSSTPATIHCTSSCSEAKYPKSYANDKVIGGKATACNTISSMMSALQRGPIVAGFTVYSDFPAYKSGVYKKTSGAVALGKHAVEIIGYGSSDSNGDFWLVRNTWNSDWGDDGFFKIARGTNECGIEQNAASIDF